MTALSVAIAPTPKRRILGSMFLGFATVFRKELTEWLRGPKTLIVAGVSIAGAVFMCLIPFIARATNQAAETGAEQSPLTLTMDPTTNVLLGWTGQTVALIAVVATMALVSSERDRGTLAWSLTNPVSPTSIIAAKFGAAFLVFSGAAVVLPLVVSSLLATIVYGSLPNLAMITSFGLLFLTLPAFYIALTIGLGTAIKSTAGVAGVAFAVMFVPQILGGLLPIIGELSPTSVGLWAMATATGEPASFLTLIGWLASMAVIVVGAKVVFDRQEF
jgi:ABC-2 type transport system permease protein